MNTLIRSFVLAMLACFLVFSSCKTTKTQRSNTEQQDYKKLENSLLWKIEGNGLSTPSYLFGTIHIIPSESYFLPTGTLSAIEACKKMVFEIDMNEMSDMSAMMGIMDKVFMNDGKTLKDLLTDEQYTLVDNHFKKLGMPLAFMERMKPMFLTVFAGGDMDPQGLQTGSMKSYEMEFMEIAKDSKMAIDGLETIEFQMSVFDSIPYKAQADMLVETIKHGDTGNNEFDKTIKMYTNQNISGMVQMISDPDEQLSEYDDILLTKRNTAWISGMKSMMAEMPTFFAVGAGHLAGQTGVIHLLKTEGYKLTPISYKK